MWVAGQHKRLSISSKTREEHMANLILMYTLKPGVSRQDFEHWVRNTDYPAMRGLKRVESFVTYRTTGLLMGDGQPSADYIEVFKVVDFTGFTSEDLPVATFQGIMVHFMGFAQAPQFILVEEIK